MILKVSRELFNDAVVNPISRRALAIVIALKDHNPTSVYKDWSLRDLGNAAGVSPNTIRKYIPVMKAMKIARTYESDGHRYLN